MGNKDIVKQTKDSNDDNSGDRKDTKNRISILEQQLNDMKRSHSDEMTQIKQEQDQALKDLERNIKSKYTESQEAYHKKIASLQAAVVQKVEDCIRVKESGKEKEKEWNNAEAEYKKQIESIQKVLVPGVPWRGASTETINIQKTQLVDLLKTHLDEKEENFSRKLKETETRLDNTDLILNMAELEKENAKLRDAHHNKVSQQKETFDKELANLSSKLKEESIMHEKQMDELKSKNEDIMRKQKEMSRQHQTTMEQIENKNKTDQQKLQSQLASVQKDLQTRILKSAEMRRSQNCACKNSSGKKPSITTKISQTDPTYDPENEQIMTLKVKIDMQEKEKETLIENNKKLLADKETEIASAHETQSNLRKTIDDQKQQFALCQINLDVAAKELELANKKIAANEDGKDISTLPVKIEESVEYTSLKNTHVEQIKGLIQK